MGIENKEPKNFRTEQITISHHGRNISGTLYLPQIPQNEKCPVVVFNHGFNGSSGDFDHYATALAQNGAVAFTFDFCGGALHSKSDMPTSEMTVFTEKDDLYAVLDTIESWDFIDGGNIFLFGASMGGLVAVLTAEERTDDIKGLILQYPALCVADDWNRQFPEIDSIPEVHNVWGVPLGRDFFETLHGFHIFEHIGKYPGKVLIMHGDKDNIVPLTYSLKADKLYRDSRLEIFHNEGHGFSSDGNNRLVKLLTNFLKDSIS